MNSFTISKLNGHASFQDLGRDHAQHLGFSGSGAADQFSYRYANYLLGNPKSAVALEITLGQISLVANQPCRMVITGADCQAFIERVGDDSQYSVHNNHPCVLNKGDTLVLGMPSSMVHSYLAIEGGFNCQHWLGSASQASNEFTLGFTEPKLKAGANLYFALTEPLAEQASIPRPPSQFHRAGELTLRFLPSPFWQQFTSEQQQSLLEQSYRISADSNRMGYRLTAKPLILPKKQVLLSQPVCYGTIQCPADGQPIVLMKDRQTMGGYPTLGVVIQTDLYRLSQKRPGESVRFMPTNLAQAQAQLLAVEQKFQ